MIPLRVAALTNARKPDFFALISPGVIKPPARATTNTKPPQRQGPLADVFLLPARVLLNGPELKGGSWHAAAVELSVAVEADLAFRRSKWPVPVGRTLGCYKDWAVAMAYHGAVYLTERHAARTKAVAACNQRSRNLQRRCSRLLAKYGLTTAVGSKTPAADLYYAAVAVLIDADKVTEWVRRRDLRKGYYGKEKSVEAFRDPYWQLKLKCICLWVPAPAGLSLELPRLARDRPTRTPTYRLRPSWRSSAAPARRASARSRCPTEACTATTASSRPRPRSCGMRNRAGGRLPKTRRGRVYGLLCNSSSSSNEVHQPVIKSAGESRRLRSRGALRAC